MKLAILSRNKNLHSIRRLLQEARRCEVSCDVINPLECELIVDGKNTRIVVGHLTLDRYDVVLPRIGASITDYGLKVLRQFEALGASSVNRAQAISDSRDKMRSLQILTEAGLQVPASVLTRSARGLKIAVQAVKGMPAVLKVPQGTQGVGVMLVHTPVSLRSVLDTMWGMGKDVILQQFISEGAGRDYRVFVIGRKVVAAMMRTAPEGEFRANIHRGGEGSLVKLPRAYARAAIQSVAALGLEIAGVDLMESRTGPMVIEVNSSPGFEGIESATGLNIAGMIVKHMEKMGRRR